MERQYADWEALRHMGDERTEYREAVTVLGKRVRALLKVESIPALRAKTRTVSRRKGKIDVRTRSIKAAPAPTGPTNVPAKRRVLVVNRLGGPGIYQTISAALEAAQGGELVTVAQGLYRETIHLAKPVEIVAEGNPGDVTVEAIDNPVLISTALFGRIKNLTLRQSGKGEEYAVAITGGSLEMDGCDIASATLSCVGVQGSEARLLRCTLHGGGQAGVIFSNAGRGTVEGCDIHSNHLVGVNVVGSSDVTIRGNRIRDGRDDGIRFSYQATGLVEDNEIFGNAGVGVSIIVGSSPVIRRNRIREGKGSGILIEDKSQGVISENEIFGNGLSGIQVRGASSPTISENHIHHNENSGLFIYAASGGLVDGNRVDHNGQCGMIVDEGAKPQVRGNYFIENELYGVWIDGKSGGVFERNEIRGSGKLDKKISDSAKPNIVWSINRNKKLARPSPKVVRAR